MGKSRLGHMATLVIIVAAAILSNFSVATVSASSVSPTAKQACKAGEYPITYNKNFPSTGYIPISFTAGTYSISVDNQTDYDLTAHYYVNYYNKRSSAFSVNGTPSAKMAGSMINSTFPIISSPDTLVVNYGNVLVYFRPIGLMKGNTLDFTVYVDCP